jgi:hypothetical protein
MVLHHGRLLHVSGDRCASGPGLSPILRLISASLSFVNNLFHRSNTRLVFIDHQLGASVKAMRSKGLGGGREFVSRRPY